MTHARESRRPLRILRAPLRPIARRYRRLPTARKMCLRRIAFAPLEAFDVVAGRRDPLVPPRWLRYVGRGEFGCVGAEFLRHSVVMAELPRDAAVLDVGCGVGRMAIPLTQYLDADGRYEGFDVVPAAIRWCQEHVSPLHPGFRFQLVDVRNRRYHPGGTAAAHRLRFPYDGATFDFALATSVFTHMGAHATRRYLSEVRRVLKPGGRCLATWFLINDESESLIARGASEIAFAHTHGPCRTLRPGDPDHLSALSEATVRELYQASGLRVREPIHYGTWCGRTDGASYQDIVVAERA